MGPKKDATGRLMLTLPMADKKLPTMASEDIGKCAYGIFKAGTEHIGKTVGIAGEHLTGAEDLGNMFQVNCDFEQEFCSARPLAVARALNPSLQTFEMWLAQNATRIPLA